MTKKMLRKQKREKKIMSKTDFNLYTMNIRTLRSIADSLDASIISQIEVSRRLEDVKTTSCWVIPSEKTEKN